MFRVTTPVHTYVLPIDTSSCSVIRVAYSQGKKKLIKAYQGGVAPEGMTLDGKNVIIRLTQEETKDFSSGFLTAQIRVLTDEGESLSSKVFRVTVDDVLDEEVMNNGL